MIKAKGKKNQCNFLLSWALLENLSNNSRQVGHKHNSITICFSGYNYGFDWFLFLGNKFSICVDKQIYNISLPYIFF